MKHGRVRSSDEYKTGWRWHDERSTERAIEEFQNGASLDDIKGKYRGWDGKPLAQWKAHVTMGTYDTSGQMQEQQVELNETASSGLSKEEAIDLLKSGFPVAEIIEAYPGSFSAGQLRAFKAHITMESYKK